MLSPLLSSVLLLFPAASSCSLFFFFFNDTATTEIYTLSLHDALPISSSSSIRRRAVFSGWNTRSTSSPNSLTGDRKSTRLNSSHRCISYAVFCLKKKKKNKTKQTTCDRRKTTLDTITGGVVKVITLEL